MKVFVCRICGDSYVGEEIPGSCPFCGAEKKFLVLAHTWQDENDIELTDISRKNLEAALKLEAGATELYRCMENTIDNSEILDAGWFSADSLPVVPPRISIARQLIDWFLGNNDKNE